MSFHKLHICLLQLPFPKVDALEKIECEPIKYYNSNTNHEQLRDPQIV